jgi:hypothetical protein
MMRVAMKKKVRRRSRKDERDTMRAEYNFSAAVRGVTAARYAEGAGIPNKNNSMQRT